MLIAKSLKGSVEVKRIRKTITIHIFLNVVSILQFIESCRFLGKMLTSAELQLLVQLSQILSLWNINSKF